MYTNYYNDMSSDEEEEIRKEIKDENLYDYLEELYDNMKDFIEYRGLALCEYMTIESIYHLIDRN